MWNSNQNQNPNFSGENLKLGANLRLIVSFDPCAPNKIETKLELDFLKELDLELSYLCVDPKPKSFHFIFYNYDQIHVYLFIL